MIRRIRDLLYDQGFTISGARNKMQEILQTEREQKNGAPALFDDEAIQVAENPPLEPEIWQADFVVTEADEANLFFIRRELFEIRDLLSTDS